MLRNIPLPPTRDPAGGQQPRARSLAAASVRRLALRFVGTTLLAGAAASAGAVVSTADYDLVTVLPAQSTSPAAVDWRLQGVVTAVKDEGQCDASWAFAATGLVESDSAIRTGTLKNLSEQQLLDCTGGGSGCGGGSPIAGLRTVIAKGGLATGAAYPYTAVAGTCKATVPVATIPGAGRVPPGDEASLEYYVSQGPVLALIDASRQSFQLYTSGIYADPDCGKDSPTQAVLIVGYGTTPLDHDYWIVKNSWGTSWGNAGYVWIARNNDNQCGIASYALAVSDDTLPPGNASGTKEMVRDVLAGLLPTGNAATDNRINKAIGHLDKSLAADLWADESHLARKGAKVFDEEQKAVDELMKIAEPPAEVTAAIAALVAADELLAQTVIDEAADGREKNAALAEMANAAEELARGRPDKAIGHYNRAWQHAIRA